MYEVANKDTMKYEILPHFACGKTRLCLKK